MSGNGEKQQEKQRRERIFSILDDLKAQGERINADKVARLAKMGKQTVLPFYNEWRFAGFAGEEDVLELPEELLHSLKRGITQWKYQLAESQRAFAESANQEIDELKQTLNQLGEKNEALSNRNAALQAQQEKMQLALEELHRQAQQKELHIKELDTLLSAEKQQSQQIQNSLEQQNAAHKETMGNLERQLDQRYQEQLNHWLGVVDDERRLKQGLEKNVATLNDKLAQLGKTHLELQSRLDGKTKMYTDACEARNQLADELQTVAAAAELAHQLGVLLDCKQEQILTQVRSIQAQSRDALSAKQQYQNEKSINEKLEHRLGEMEKNMNRLHTVELELERVRGAAEALAQRTDNKEAQL